MNIHSIRTFIAINNQYYPFKIFGLSKKPLVERVLAQLRLLRERPVRTDHPGGDWDEVNGSDKGITHISRTIEMKNLKNRICKFNRQVQYGYHPFGQSIQTLIFKNYK